MSVPRGTRKDRMQYPVDRKFGFLGDKLGRTVDTQTTDGREGHKTPGIKSFCLFHAKVYNGFKIPLPVGFLSAKNLFKALMSVGRFHWLDGKDLEKS